MAIIKPPPLVENLSERALTNYADGALIDKGRFTSREYLQRENERLWSRTWNMACRESEVRGVGDYCEFTLAGESILVIRETPNQLRAVSNVCRHRGTHLKSGSGTTRELRCPFHGWTYAFDGTLREITRAWDFPHVDKAKTCLPSFRVDTWQGFVFVNLDNDAEPLRDYLEPIRETAELFNLENCYRVFALRMIVLCNWKLCQAAFFENYHAPWTHPQTGNFSPEQDAACYIPLGRHAQFIPDFGPDIDPEFQSAAQAMQGVDLQQLAEQRLGLMLVFPNWEISSNLYTRWLPHGDDPDSSIMETCMMAPVPEGSERPLDAPFREVDGNDAGKVMAAWGESAFMAEVANQDISNLRTIQRGLKSRFYPGVILSLYQESLIRHHLETLDDYLARP